jgi:hypothetical protein
MMFIYLAFNDKWIVVLMIIIRTGVHMYGLLLIFS